MPSSGDHWKPLGPTCRDCLNSIDDKSSFNPESTMITPNGHGTPLKNPQNLTAGCNGSFLLKKSHNKAHIIKTHINNSKNSNHIEKTGHHLNLVKESLCCFKKSNSSLNKQEQTEEDSASRSESCGLGSLKPPWLQPFANKKVFLAVFCLTSVLQGMYYTYFVSVLTTIEKLYQIQSKTTGLIMSATEVGQIGGALLLTYYGGQGHRPKWIGFGMLVFAAASIFCATPHFLYSEMTSRLSTSNSENSTTAALRELKSKLCQNEFNPVSVKSPVYLQLLPSNTSDGNFTDNAENRLALGSNLGLSNETSRIFELPSVEAWTINKDECQDKNKVNMHYKTTNTVLVIFFISLLLIGIGATAVYTLGIPYIDDNVATRESPLYFGITIGVRIFGPVFGFLLGSFCTSIYVNFPFETTEITTDNPQWLGAWWLGVLIVGAALILTSFPMMAFPRALPTPCKHREHSKSKKSTDDSEAKLLKYDGTTDSMLCNESDVTNCNGNNPAILNANNGLINLNGNYESTNFNEHITDPMNGNTNSQNINGNRNAMNLNGNADLANLTRNLNGNLDTVNGNGNLGSTGCNGNLDSHCHANMDLVNCNENKDSTPYDGPNCQLCQQSMYYKNKDMVKPTLKDFPSAMKRLLNNEILLYRTASSVLHILPIAGLYTFLPKYLESQFQLTATMANMISGIAGILVMGIGIFASGTFMRKFNPDARFVARWIAMSALLYAVGMVILMMFGCPLNSYVGLNAGSEFEDTSRMICNETCNCRPGEFSPICTSEGVTYLSPCLAGCTEVIGSSYEELTYKNCLCLGANVTATNGFCPLECDSLLPYVCVFALFVLVHSTSEVGSMLLTLRCVEPKDKALALGLIAFAIGLFGNVPCPIIYGAVVDSACLFWEDNCGEPGACRLYDPSKFRAVFHGVTACIMLMAFCVDVIVWYKAEHIHFQEFGKDDEEETTPFNESVPNPLRESRV